MEMFSSLKEIFSIFLGNISQFSGNTFGEREFRGRLWVKIFPNSTEIFSSFVGNTFGGREIRGRLWVKIFPNSREIFSSFVGNLFNFFGKYFLRERDPREAMGENLF